MDVIRILRPTALLVVFFCILMTAVSAVPPLPAEFFGSVSVGGVPAPAGTTLIAKINDQVRGEIEISTPGQYGGSGIFDNKLVIGAKEDDLKSGTATITFYIGNTKADQTVPYEPGSAKKLDLTSGGGCNIVAEFSGTPLSGNAPLTVQFTDQSTGKPTMWAWDFGDGGTDMVANPVHTYQAVGTYTVRLTASSQTGGSNTKVKERYVTVGQPGPGPKAAFTADKRTGQKPLTVQFSDKSTGGPTMWAWDFGDGTSDMVANPVHTYKEAGLYTVSLTASNTAGSDKKTEQDYISVTGDIPPPVAMFEAKPLSGDAPLNVQFTDLSIGPPISYAWDFGDGSTSCEPNPVHKYESRGSFTVKLTVKNSGGSNTMKRDNYINVGPSGGITADFSGTPTSGTAPLTVQFTDMSTGKPTMWAWDFGDGTSDMVANPIHVYSKPGQYTVKLTASSQTGGTSTKVKERYINAGPSGGIVADFSGMPTSGIAPLTVQFTDMSTGKPTMWAWDFGDGTSDMVANPIHVYSKPGQYTVKLTASSQTGGTSTKVKERYINAGPSGGIVADFVGSPTSGGVPLSVQFTDRSQGGPIMWAWDFGDSGTDMRANPLHVYSKPGRYTVKLTASNQQSSNTAIKPDYISVQQEPHGSGVIRIIYAPDRSTVYVDNILKGETKFLQTFIIGNLQPGTHQLKITKAGFMDFVIGVPVRPDRATDVIADMRLQPTPNGILSVYTYPIGSAVYLDGASVGNGPVWLANVVPGVHQVRVSSPGYLDWNQVVDIKGGGAVVYVTAALYPSWWTPITGNVMITSLPSNAAVFLDGIPRGSTPVTLSQVIPGNHNVRIELPGYQPWEQIVNVMEGRTAYVMAQMTVGNSPVVPASTGEVNTVAAVSAVNTTANF